MTKSNYNYQSRVSDWAHNCFGSEASKNQLERTHRYLEESLELAQSSGCTVEDAYKLVDYVFSRDPGDVNQEAGGSILTLAALCSALDIDMVHCGETELERVTEKIDSIRSKHADRPKNSPLPISGENIMSFRTECESDAISVPALMEAVSATIIGRRNEEVAPQFIIVNFTCDAPEGDSVDEFRAKMKEQIDTYTQFNNMHRCYQTLASGHSPNENWY